MRELLAYDNDNDNGWSECYYGMSRSGSGIILLWHTIAFYCFLVLTKRVGQAKIKRIFYLAIICAAMSYKESPIGSHFWIFWGGQPLLHLPLDLLACDACFPLVCSLFAFTTSSSPLSICLPLPLAAGVVPKQFNNHMYHRISSTSSLLTLSSSHIDWFWLGCRNNATSFACHFGVSVGGVE